MQNKTLLLVDEIVARYAADCNCAQAVFSGLAARYGLDPELAGRIASSFGAGIARQGQICGAVSGALMALGLGYGHTCPPANLASKQRSMMLSQELISRFRARQGEITCAGLLGFDIGDPERRAAENEKGTFDTVCPGFVRAAAEVFLELAEELDAAQH